MIRGDAQSNNDAHGFSLNVKIVEPYIFVWAFVIIHTLIHTIDKFATTCISLQVWLSFIQWLVVERAQLLFKGKGGRYIIYLGPISSFYLVYMSNNLQGSVSAW